MQSKAVVKFNELKKVSVSSSIDFKSYINKNNAKKS